MFNRLKSRNCNNSWQLSAFFFTYILKIIANHPLIDTLPFQAITWSGIHVLSTGLLGIHFNEINIEIETFICKETHLKMLSTRYHSFCSGRNVLNVVVYISLPLHRSHNFLRLIFRVPVKAIFAFWPRSPCIFNYNHVLLPSKKFKWSRWLYVKF